MLSAKKGCKTKERDWHSLISIHPHSPPQEERRIVCTKTSKKNNKKKKLWIAPAALWSKDEERRPRLKAKRWRKDKGLPVPWRYDLRVVPVCGTHLHVNTGSRRWKWALALRRSWTCWATGGRRRNAGGWAPSCWTNPTLSYVPSPRPRCSFCHQKKHLALLTSETCGGSIRAAGRFRIRRQRILT